MSAIETYNPDPRPTIGSGDVGVILRHLGGRAPRYADASPIKLWAELSGLVPWRTDGPTAAQEAGRRFERTLLQWYADSSGRYVEPLAPGMSFRGAFPWMRATPDGVSCLVSDLDTAEGWSVLNADSSALIEAKWVGQGGVWRELPIDVWAQVSWQLQCSHQDYCDVAAFFVNAREFRVYRVDRDYPLEDRMRRAVWGWYERHVLGGRPPENDHSAVAQRTLAKALRVRRERTIATQGDLDLVRRLRNLDTQLSTLNVERDQLRTKLRLRLGDAREIAHPSGPVLARRSKDGKLLVRKETPP